MSTLAPNSPAPSHRKIQANRRNARKSTGPRTNRGKARSSRNAITHGVFARDLLLPGEDQQLFDRYRLGMLRRLNPRDELELQYADRVIHCGWRLKRFAAAHYTALQDKHRLELRWRAKNPEDYGDDEFAPLPATPGWIFSAMIWNDDLERFQKHERHLATMMNTALMQLRELQEEDPQEVNDFTRQLIEQVQNPGSEKIQNEPNSDSDDASDDGAEACDDVPGLPQTVEDLEAVSKPDPDPMHDRSGSHSQPIPGS